jgi:hypothetical protein
MNEQRCKASPARAFCGGCPYCRRGWNLRVLRRGNGRPTGSPTRSERHLGALANSYPLSDACTSFTNSSHGDSLSGVEKQVLIPARYRGESVPVPEAGKSEEVRLNSRKINRLQNRTFVSCHSICYNPLRNAGYGYPSDKTGA